MSLFTDKIQENYLFHDASFPFATPVDFIILLLRAFILYYIWFKESLIQQYQSNIMF